MIWLARRLRHDFPTWERSAQIAFVLALGLFVVAVLLVFFGPEEARLGALIGGIGLLITLQVTVLWANRGMVSPFTQAQRAYLDEDFEQAKLLLEQERAAGRADMRALTLLGNTYRQLGQLNESRTVLYEALDKAPNHHYPLYGIGRTLLSEGNYGEAAQALERALAAGAPAAVRVDYAEALYRANLPSEAVAQLERVEPHILEEEAFRQLMTQYLLYRLHAGTPPEADVIRLGLPYWEATATRFRQTRYGDDLAQDIQHMRGRLE